MLRAHTAQKSSGFTLLELIMTIAILAIFLGLAVPGFLNAIQNSRVSAQANDLVTAFQLARSEALQRNRPISICAADTSAATPTCGSDWDAGWMVIVDAEAAGSGNAPSYNSYATDVLRVWPALDGDAGISGADADDFVRYLPNGQIDITPAANAPEFELRIPDCSGDRQRNISISRTGRAGVERVECT